MTVPTHKTLALVAAGAIDRRSIEPPVLVVGDPTGLVAAGVARITGVEPAAWVRRASRRQPEATPWPPAGPFATAILRLPKAGDELDMSLHALASAVRAGGSIWLYGANSEGIRSAPRRLARVGGKVETVVTAGHGRVLLVERPEEINALRPRLADWRSTVTIDLGGSVAEFATYPGLFARGALDPATRMLIAALPPLEPGMRVLDFGCGTGVVSRALFASAPGIECLAADNDAVAVLAARENVPEAQVVLAHDLASVGKVGFDLIVSNPPLHDGRREDHATLEALIAAAPPVLTANGILQLVTQRRIGARTLFERAFETVAVVAQSGVFEVIRATKPLRPPRRRR